MTFISSRQLQGLKQYKYKAGGYTVLDDIHNPIWNWLVDRLPMWLAPNLITLAAALCILTAYIVNVVYLPEFSGEAPRWVYALTGVSVFLYVNLDCMDGKQARRTGSSSPLGQLFDHGLDALVLHMMLGNIAASLQLPCSLKMAAGCLAIMTPWMLAQWEEYHTGIMMYGSRSFGVIEANYGICVVHFLTAWFGPGMWKLMVPMPLLVQGWLGAHASLGDLSLAAVSAQGVSQALFNIWRVLLPAGAQPLAAEEVGDKALGRPAAVKHLLGLLLVLALGGGVLQQAEAQGALHARLALLSFGMCFALAASHLIMAHMCKGALSPPWLPAGLLALKAAATPLSLALAGESSAEAALYAALLLTALCVYCYLEYVLSAISQISSFLGIKVLTIHSASKPQQAGVDGAQQQHAAPHHAADSKAEAAPENSCESLVTTPSGSSSHNSDLSEDLADATADSVVPVIPLVSRSKGAVKRIKRPGPQTLESGVPVVV